MWYVQTDTLLSLYVQNLLITLDSVHVCSAQAVLADVSAQVA